MINFPKRKSERETRYDRYDSEKKRFEKSDVKGHGVPKQLLKMLKQQRIVFVRVKKVWTNKPESGNQ